MPWKTEESGPATGLPPWDPVALDVDPRGRHLQKTVTLRNSDMRA